MKTREAVYIGRRITVKNHLAYFWYFAEDQERPMKGYKKQITPALIGEKWKFTYDDKDHIFTGGEHRPVKVDFEETNLKKWVAEEQAAIQQDAERRANKKLEARLTEFQRRITPLKELVDAVKTYDERAAVIARITTELWRR